MDAPSIKAKKGFFILKVRGIMCRNEKFSVSARGELIYLNPY